MTDVSAWVLFPFPTLVEGRRHDGSLFEWPAVCVKCKSRPCETAPGQEIQICPFGMTFARINERVLLAGVVMIDSANPTKAEKKRRRSEPSSLTKHRDIATAVDNARQIGPDAEAEVAAEKARLIEEFISSDRSRTEVIEELRGLISRNLDQSHDFVALLKQIKANVLTVFETRFPGSDATEAADQLENEGAIYYAAELMLGKIDATKYLREPNLVYGRSTTFSLHRFLTKYIKIYRSFAKQRDLDFFVSGECFASVHYNSEAVGALIHALLDNVVKYAPVRSKVDISFKEKQSDVEVTFRSLGPRILPHERKKIFLPGFRSAAATALEPTGIGLGLATARVVSDGLDLELKMSQDDRASSDHPSYYPTEFSLRFEMAT